MHGRDLFETPIIRAQFRQANVHEGLDSRAKIRRAECKEAESPVPLEFQFLPDFLDRFNESSVHRREVTGSLHRYQTHVILHVTPDKKSFFFVKKYLLSGGKSSVIQTRGDFICRELFSSGKLFFFNRERSSIASCYLKC